MSVSTLPQLPALTQRGGDAISVVKLLQDQHARKLDLVVPASTLRFNQGNLELAGLEPMLADDGVLDPSGAYRTVGPVVNQLSTILDIPGKYIRKLQVEVPSLLDTNLNELAARSNRKLLVRALWGSNPDDPATSGVVRAILSDRYKTYDNLDTLLSVLAGMRAAGLDANNIDSVDLSDNRLYMKVRAPEIQALAKDFLKGYRSPFTGQSGDDLPVVFAGMVITNSEVGEGAFNITPEVVVQVCKNGLNMSADKFRKVHLGGKLEEGQINWSSDTVAASNEFVKLQVKDAVKSFLSTDYLEHAVTELTKDAGVEVTEPEKTIKHVASTLVYSKAETESLMNFFMKGGQPTSGGVAQAVTAMSQTIEDVDRAHDFNVTAVRAMQVAAKFAA